MSTNYYLKRIPTEEEIAQCHRLLDERKIEYCDTCDEPQGTPYLEEVLGQMTEEIHIGKLDGGWRFLFKIQDDLYGKSIQSCLEYLKRQLDTGLWRIMNEYGETLSLEEFEKTVRDSLRCITIDDYYRTHPEEKMWYSYGPQQTVVEDGSRWWDADFC